MRQGLNLQGHEVQMAGEGGAEWAGVQVAGKDSTSRRVGGNSEFLETEASVFFREPSGWPWAERPESEPAPASVHFTPSTVAVGASGHAPLTVAAFADGVYHLSLIHMSATKPILELVVKSGNVRIRSLQGADVDQTVKGEVFEGVIASGFNISRYGSPAAAASGLQLQARLGASSAPVHGIGEEAFLSTAEENNPRGEKEYKADGFVRERNLTAYFLIPGDEEADRSAALILLHSVADEL